MSKYIDKNTDLRHEAHQLYVAGVIGFHAHRQLLELIDQNLPFNKLQEKWNQIIAFGDEQMTDDKWEAFKDSRWTQDPHKDPVIQYHEKQRKQSEFYWDEQFKEFNNRHKKQKQDDIEESKVDTDDFFDTTLQQIEKENDPQGYIPEGDDAFEQALNKATALEELRHHARFKKPMKPPKWMAKLKGVTSTAAKIDKNLRNKLPEPKIEGVTPNWDNPPMPKVPKGFEPTDFKPATKYNNIGDYLLDKFGKKDKKDPPKDPNPKKDPNPTPGPLPMPGTSK